MDISIAGHRRSLGSKHTLGLAVGAQERRVDQDAIKLAAKLGREALERLHEIIVDEVVLKHGKAPVELKHLDGDLAGDAAGILQCGPASVSALVRRAWGQGADLPLTQLDVDRRRRDQSDHRVVGSALDQGLGQRFRGCVVVPKL